MISQFENQVLVAVPAGVWHRTVARRALPRAALQKPVLVEVSASVDSDRAIADAARPVRLWIGLLNTAFEDMVTFEEDTEPEYGFVDASGQLALPHAQALVDVGNNHFAFLTAVSDAGAEPARPGEAMLDDRMALVEGQMASLQAGMQKLLAQPSAAQPPPVAPPEQHAPRKPALRRPALPGLAADVVQSALAAGVPEAHLEEVQKMVSFGRAKSMMVKHPAPGLAGGDLGETDDEDEAAGDTEEAVGPATPQDPMQVAVVQLTRLVSEMAKEKKQPSRGLEQLLDKAEGGGGESGGSVKSGCASRLTRGSMQHTGAAQSEYRDPDGGGPAVTAERGCFFRHKGNSPRLAGTSVPAGVLPEYHQVGVGRCRDPGCVAGQEGGRSSCSRGTSTCGPRPISGRRRFLAASAGGPAGALPPLLGTGLDELESPQSRLLDPRWMELFIHKAKEQDAYGEVRKKLGRVQKGAAPEEENVEKKKKRGGGASSSEGAKGAGKHTPAATN